MIVLMLLIDNVNSVYGTARTNRARFLKDTPDILLRELGAGLRLAKSPVRCRVAGDRTEYDN